MRISEISLYQVNRPLSKPYKVSSRVFHSFRPVMAEIVDSDGRRGWGEIVISSYAKESLELGWAFCREFAPRLIGMEASEAKQAVLQASDGRPNASGVLVTALEMLEGNPLLRIDQPTRVPLLDPIHSHDPAAIPDEVEQLLARGFRTFKVKVGFDVDQDLARVRVIQRAAAGRAEIRLDANRAFSREQGCRFGAGLDPAGIVLFEQPCAMDDWDANAAVAAVSTVPVMLDESILSYPKCMAQIERAATMPGVGYVKLKLKKLGSVDRLKEGLDHIRANGLRSVLGDGVAGEFACWMEACVARKTIDNAGEMNGFLKITESILTEPLPFQNGDIVLVPGYRPDVDRDRLRRYTEASERFATPNVGVAAVHG